MIIIFHCYLGDYFCSSVRFTINIYSGFFRIVLVPIMREWGRGGSRKSAIISSANGIEGGSCLSLLQRVSPYQVSPRLVVLFLTLWDESIDKFKLTIQNISFTQNRIPLGDHCHVQLQRLRQTTSKNSIQLGLIK